MIDKIKIGGIDYKIKLLDLSSRNEGEHGVSMGFCVYQENTIEINKHLHPERQKQTIIHEMVHAMFCEVGIDQDEDTVNRLGNILHQVLKENNFSWVQKS